MSARARRPSTWIAVCIGLLAVWAAVTACTSSGPARPDRARNRGDRTRTAKTCAECHDDFMAELKLARGHFDDIENRCEDCHERHGLVGVLNLKRDEPALCLECHEESRSYLESHPHTPIAEGRCSACHDPHGSTLPALLLGEGADLCFTCHDPEAFRTGNVHEPVAEDCGLCHDSHTNATSEGLKQAVPQLCAGCHDGATEVFTEAHGGHDVAASNCASCHSPHASVETGLLRPVVHEPLADRDCSMCHVDPEDASGGPRGPETLLPPDKVCAVCHRAEIAAYKELPGQHLPVAEQKCIECHSPHASEHEGLLVASGDRALCSSCHETHLEIAELASGNGTPHTPAFEGKCMDCHDPHGGPDQNLLKLPENELCLSCHDAVKAHFDREFVHEPLGQCTSCHAGHGSEQPLLLKSSLGDLCLTCHTEHAERFRTEIMHRPVAQGKCLLCHDAHSSDHAGGLRSSRNDLCLECHSELARTVVGGSVHTPVEKGECLDCHDAHSGRDAQLLVAEGGELCAKCHGLTQQAIDNAAFRHAPAEAGACLACHESHHAPRPKLLTLPDRDLCGTCHSDLLNEMNRPGYHGHTPAQEGKCLECHLPHASDAPGLANEPVPGLCLRCHDPSEAAFQTKHLGLTTATTDCLSCHTPHAAEGPGLFWPNRHPPFADNKCEDCHDDL